jgi:hypothetical protein
MFKYISLFIVSLIVFITYKAPVSLLQNLTHEFQLSGKIIDGSAYSAKFGLVKFNFEPLELLSGKLSFFVNIKKDNSEVSLMVGADVFTDIVFYDVTGNINTDYAKIFNSSFIKNIDMLNTNLNIKKLNITISDKKSFIPKTIDANIVAQNVAVIGEKIGSYDINIKTIDGLQVASIQDTKNSIFKTNFNAKLIGKNIEISGSIVGKNNDSEELLDSFGISENFNRTFKIK